jgi:4-alpha-glucanotransferase
LKQVISARANGILLHVSSLPSPHGIGDLEHAFEFIDFLAAAGQTYWQVLPLGPTSPIFGSSPYMSFSAFAGNPLFIAPELLYRDGLLDSDDLAAPGFSEYFVEFDKVIPWKERLLAKAWQRFRTAGNRSGFEQFRDSTEWLADHTLFMALKRKFNQKPWYQWPEEVCTANRKSLLVAEAELAESIEYYQFEQYLFFSQWHRMRQYAAEKGVRIIGDLPVYVGLDSVDVWANQNIFELRKKSRLPASVAGVPPDYFSSTGQLWGNPLYRWNTRKGVVKDQLYDWWTRRFATVFSLVDVLRIDHFRGFESYWSVPGNDRTAEHGTWKKGPGLVFFREMEKRLGHLPVIAEDLGMITPEVEKLRDNLGYPGMKILQFAFDGNPANPYLPCNYDPNCVVFTGTHDNDTVLGWYLDPDVPEESKQQFRKAANRQDCPLQAVHRDFIYLAMSSTAVLSILPMQDILGFGNDCRMNMPSTPSGNWVWRCAPRYFSDEISTWLLDQTRFFNRLPEPEPSKPSAGEKK